MRRICEPELMDSAEQASVYAEADFSRSDAALVERIIAMAPPAGLGPRLVDLGCGPGNISFPLADRLPATDVIGIDGSAAMLAIADGRRNAIPGGWPNLRFRCLRLPLTALELQGLEGRCSALVSNSLLHHLHDPAVFWRTAQQLGSRGAWLHLQDLRRPDDEQALEALVRRHAAGAPPLLEHDYRASLSAAFTPEEVRAQLAAHGLGSLRVSSLEDRYLEVVGPLP